MLNNYLRFLTANASDYARDLGYLKESITFETKVGNAGNTWKEHFQKCHSEVLLQTEGLSPSSTIWVLGSGSLYETPWPQLLEKSFFLKLVDLYHPSHVKAVAKKNSKIELIECDMTGFQNLPMLKKILLKVPEPPTLPVQSKDFVISSNLWSQLPVCPLEFLDRNTEVSLEEKIQWAKNLQKNHCDWLLSFGCNGLIFSDFETHQINSRGAIIKIDQQPWRPQSLRKVNEWNWHWSKNSIRKMEAYSISRKT